MNGGVLRALWPPRTKFLYVVTTVLLIPALALASEPINITVDHGGGDQTTIVIMDSAIGRPPPKDRVRIKDAIEAMLGSTLFKNMVKDARNADKKIGILAQRFQNIELGGAELREEKAWPLAIIDVGDVEAINSGDHLESTSNAARDTVKDRLLRMVVVHELMHLALKTAAHNGPGNVIEKENTVYNQLGLGVTRKPDPDCATHGRTALFDVGGTEVKLRLPPIKGRPWRWNKEGVRFADPNCEVDTAAPVSDHAEAPPQPEPPPTSVEDPDKTIEPQPTPTVPPIEPVPAASGTTSTLLAITMLITGLAATWSRRAHASKRATGSSVPTSRPRQGS